MNTQRKLKTAPNGSLIGITVNVGDDAKFFELTPLQRFIVSAEKDAEGFHALIPLPPSQDQVNAFLIGAVNELKAELRGMRVELSLNTNTARVERMTSEVKALKQAK